MISRVDSVTSSVGEPAVANRAVMNTMRGTVVGGSGNGRKSLEVSTRRERERVSGEEEVREGGKCSLPSSSFPRSKKNHLHRLATGPRKMHKSRR